MERGLGPSPVGKSISANESGMDALNGGFSYMLVEGSGEFRIVEREVVSFDESEDIRWKPTSKSARLTDD